MTTNKRQQQQLLVLNAVAENSSITLIAKALTKDKGNTYRVLKRMERKDLVFRSDKYWYLSDLGKKTIKQKTTNNGLCTEKTTDVTVGGVKVPIKFRSHHVTVYVSHRMDKAVWDLRFRGQLPKLWIPRLKESVAVMFAKKGIQFTIQTPASSDRAYAGQLLHDRVCLIVDKVSSRFKCRFVRPADLGIKVNYQELALLGTRLAEKHVSAGKRLLVYDWEHGGKPRWLADLSKSEGVKNPEFEHVGEWVWDDEVESRWFIEELAEGRVRENISAVDKLIPAIGKVIEAQSNSQSQMDYYAENMSSHVRAVQDLSKGVSALTGVVSDLKQAFSGGGFWDVPAPRLPSLLELAEEFDWVHEVLCSLSIEERNYYVYGIKNCKGDVKK